MLDWIGKAPVERYAPAPEVPDQRPAAGAQDATDFGEPGRRVVPVVQRQGAHDYVECSVGERHRRHVTDDELWLVSVARSIRSGPLDHGRVEIQTCDLESVLTGQQNRQTSWPAAHLEHLRPLGRDRRDVGGDASGEGAQQEAMTERVVEGSVADEDPPGRTLPHRAPGVSHHDSGANGDRPEHDHDGSGPRTHEVSEEGRAKKWSPLWSSTCSSSAIGSLPASRNGLSVERVTVGDGHGNPNARPVAVLPGVTGMGHLCSLVARVKER
jgi:hypothetical protein